MAFKSYYKLVKYKGPAERHLPFYVEDVSGQNSTLTVKSLNGDATNVEYSTDGQTWSSTNPNLSANGRVYIRANATTWSTSPGFNGGIHVTNKFNVGGNIMSLLYGSNFTGTEIVFPDMTKMYVFNGFFYNTKVISAEKLALSATTLASNCYRGMFYNCTSLTKTPALPATTLDVGCYQQMFYGCTSLTTAPALPATTLAQRCYNQMFLNCTSLTAAPALPATTLAQGCYNNMFYGCTNLIQAPALPATTLAQGCYYEMFLNCTSLNSVTCLAEDISATNCTATWLNGVSATGTFTKSPNMSSWTTGASGIPSGWTVQDAQ